MNSKRGQETGTALIWWLVALVVFGLIIWFAYNFYNTGAKKVALLPEDISIYAGLCDVYGSSDLITSKLAYCTEFKEIKVSGSKVYLSCQDARVQAVIKNKIDCTGLAERDTAISKCKELKRTAVSGPFGFDGSKIFMNELGTCEELLTENVEAVKTCTELDGRWVTLDAGGCSGAGEDYTGKTITYSDGLTEEGPSNYICCQLKEKGIVCDEGDEKVEIKSGQTAYAACKEASEKYTTEYYVMKTEGDFVCCGDLSNKCLTGELRIEIKTGEDADSLCRKNFGYSLGTVNYNKGFACCKQINFD